MLENVIRAGKYQLPLNQGTLVMGIVNVTPDSFSDGGKYHSVERALAHARQLVADGAHILDVGGESTRPGFEAVPLELELERVIPVVERISLELDIPISVDTYKAGVAKEAIAAGAHIINDVWGAKRDRDMAKVMAESNAPVILMHNRNNQEYDDLIMDMKQDLQESIDIVTAAGVHPSQIILDPGIGFAKTLEDNITVMKHLDVFVNWGYPVLLGTSRKSMIGKTLDLPPEERLEGTLATVGFGISKGCHIVRVHDVKETVRFSKMMDVLLAGSQM